MNLHSNLTWLLPKTASPGSVASRSRGRNLRQVKSYPTLKYFVNGGEPVDYEGGRDASSIAEWLRKREKPAVEELSDSQVRQLEAEADGVLLLNVECSQSDS